MLHSNKDRPDLAKILIRSQVAFASSLAVVYLRLALYRLGVGAVYEPARRVSNRT